VVSGKDEARRTLAGVVAGLPDLGGSFTLFDIGGGSTGSCQLFDKYGRAVMIWVYREAVPVKEGSWR
jgi:hypothetical protein